MAQMNRSGEKIADTVGVFFFFFSTVASRPFIVLPVVAV
jgi:hypothetical protein